MYGDSCDCLHSLETATSPVKSEIQSLPTVEKSATETETTEFTPKPTPRRKGEKICIYTS